MLIITDMPLSKERDKLRKRAERGTVMLSPTEALVALPLDKRKDLLAEIAKHAIEKPVTAGHKIAAIKELNLMEHVYEAAPNVDNRQINIYVDTEAKGLLSQIGGRLDAIQESGASQSSSQGEAEEAPPGCDIVGGCDATVHV